jgi:hypothetical protein
MSATHALRAATLECDHCGGVAIESSTGLFGEGDSDRCDTCGMPGHVSVDEAYEDEDSPGLASWSVRDEDGAVCRDLACEQCAEFRSVPPIGGAK